ncbi:MAG: hypothetical protein ABSG42_00675 [Nitrospirota bacterium]
MRRRSLLFVTYRNNGHFDDGLSYAIHLAKTLGKDLSVLLLKERGLIDKFSDMIATSAFAEACEPTAAIEMSEGRKTRDDAGKRGAEIGKKCRMEGVDVQVRATDKDLLPAIRESIAESDNIEMVLLGPTVTDGGSVSARELSRLVKSATRPVITIARHANVV